VPPSNAPGSLPVVFRGLADSEVHEIQAWYEARQAGLGARFRASIDLVVALIGEHPFACAVSHREVRRALVPGFPYALFYVALPDRIRVLACLHQRRGPAFIRKRLRR
jgi:plasmid stabilization system protein ParE